MEYTPSSLPYLPFLLKVMVHSQLKTLPDLYDELFISSQNLIYDKKLWFTNPCSINMQLCTSTTKSLHSNSLCKLPISRDLNIHQMIFYWISAGNWMNVKPFPTKNIGVACVYCNYALYSLNNYELGLLNQPCRKNYGLKDFGVT